jgi:kynurenine formamidase
MSAPADGANGGAVVPPLRAAAPHIHSRRLSEREYEPGELGVVHDAQPADLLRALQLPTCGEIYDLDPGRWNGMPMSRSHPPFLLTSYRTPHGLAMTGEFGGTGEVFYTSELMVGTAHSGTHIDALGHIACGPHAEYHGGYTESEIVGDFGLTRADAASIAPFVCRGVLADIPALLGQDRLDDNHEVSSVEVQAALATRGVSVQAGDAVLIRTGWIQSWLATASAVSPTGHPGIGPEAARWLTSQRVCLVGGDTSALERLPTDDPLILPVHVELLQRSGVHIIEMAYLEELALDEIGVFLFVCLPLRIRGATGSMVRPVAIA